MVDKIEVHGARVHNLKNIDVDIPLNEIVAIAGVSGSGKSSLALGVLYAEGSRRYLDSLSTYTRRRLTESAKADVDEVIHVPASLALRQRPGVPGLRSTFGTGTELLNTLRLIFSRLASHVCPNGHYVEPTLNVAAEKELVCPLCGAHFFAPSAEDLSFNSTGACKECDGTGEVWSVDRSTLVPDEGKTIEEGAVAPWNSLMWSLMVDVCREMGVRTNVPFCQLTEKEKEIVYDGLPEKKHILYRPKNGAPASELDFTYYSAVRSVENALSKVKDEQGMKRVQRFLKREVCPACHGSRLSNYANSPRVMGSSLAEVCTLSLDKLSTWVSKIPSSLPKEMYPMAKNLCSYFLENARRVLDLGLGYISLDRATSTLSNGERQRMQLSKAVRNKTTGVLYVLDEPSIGLHPANVDGLVEVMRSLKADGNSVVFVDHDARLLAKADHLIEMGKGAGSEGGEVIAEGSIKEVEDNPSSLIAPFLSDNYKPFRSSKYSEDELFKEGVIELETDKIHTVKPLEVKIPKGRLTVVTGVSGSGKTTMVLESLIPALSAMIEKKELPKHVKMIKADGIKSVKLIDSSPIGINIRSTIATYAGVHDELRKVFAKCAKGYKAGDFSYNTGSLRCPVCDGTGEISLDVQFLPDVDIPCPECHGSRYSRAAESIKYHDISLPALMDMEVSKAKECVKPLKTIYHKLEVLESLGLGYLRLGEATPTLSGGEAQRLKLSNEIGKSQSDTLFVFDEPTIGLHPLDVKSLLAVIDSLLSSKATLVVIEHDLDVIKGADFIIDMGPGGGEEGGRIVASGTLQEVKKAKESVTARYLS